MCSLIRSSLTLYVLCSRIINMVTRQGATWANTLGSVGMMWSNAFLRERNTVRRSFRSTDGKGHDWNHQSVCLSTALLYSVFGVAIEKARGAEDDINTVAAGTLTGMMFKSTGEWKSTWCYPKTKHSYIAWEFFFVLAIWVSFISHLCVCARWTKRSCQRWTSWISHLRIICPLQQLGSS